MGKKKKKKKEILGYYDWYAPKKKKKDRYYRNEVLPQSVKDKIADDLERFMELKEYCMIIDNASIVEHDAACDKIYELIELLRDGSPLAEDEALDTIACERYMEELENLEREGSREY